ncbi:hypothetical protein HOD88_03625 [archaeon]|jgi:hypothetical protein|nr:hypothetical protein [archaeon]
MIKRGLIFCLLFISLMSFASALGASPAKKMVNFEAGKTLEIEYITFAIDSDTELFVSVEGYFAPYVKLSKEKLIGEDSFILTLEMPEKVDLPGPHRLVVQIAEAVDEELLSSTVGTTVTLRLALIIDVPYPGEYLDAHLIAPDVNVGEEVTFEINLKSQGDKTIVASPRIEIEDNFGKLLETLILKERTLGSQEGIELKKSLDTTNYNAGNYLANLIVPYGSKIANESKNFRIGDLTIDILNYTEIIEIGGYGVFEVDIESGWNDQIDGASAEIILFENNSEKISFKTSTTDLSPWERKTISGFFDTNSFEEGIYYGNVTVSYFGKSVGKSASKQIQVEFISKTNTTLIIGAVILAILIIGGVIFIFLKKKRKKINEKKK